MLLRSWPLAVVGAALLVVAGCAQLVVPELSHMWIVKPGEERRGAIQLVNAGPEPLSVQIRQADYLFYADGRNEYPSPGSVKRSNADWISLELSGSRLRLEPGGEVSVPYTLQVPDDLDLAGTYWSLVKVDTISHGAGAVDGDEVAVRQAYGYGIQLVTHIGETGSRRLELVGKSAMTTENGLLLEVDLANRGERWLRPVVWIEVHRSSGEYVGRFHSGRRRIYPGCSVRFRVPLPPLERGSYPTALIVDNLDEYVWAAEVSVEVQ